MKNIKYPIIALALLAVSCQKSDDGSTTNGTDAVIFTASANLTTRAEFTETWNNGDLVGIYDFDNVNNNYEYSVSVNNDGTANLFSVGSSINYPNSVDDEFNVFAYHPYNEGGLSIDLSKQEDLLISDTHQLKSKKRGETVDPINFTFTHA